VPNHDPKNLCVEFGPEIGAKLDTIIQPPVNEPVSGIGGG
jgi:hypothetical protein